MAVFAAAAFGVGIVTIAALDRIGAPDPLVRALGPIYALVGLAIFGLGARNADLASFLAARRGLPAFYGALNVVAVAAGMALCLDPGLASPADPPWLGVFAGVALGAAGFGPLLRRFGATSLTDVIATRFPRSPVRAASALAVWIAAALTAVAGYRLAVAETQALVTSNRALAETIAAIALALSVAPGGLAGVVWCAAASAGAIVMIVGVGAAAAWGLGVGPPDPEAVFASASVAASSLDSIPPIVATTLAVAGFFAFESAAVASPDARTAAKAGLGGFIMCLALVALASAAHAFFSFDLKPGAAHPVAASFLGAAALASALALARAGVHTSSRALGAALAQPPKPYPTLASVRLARMRAAQLAIVIGAAVFDREGLIDPRTGLIVAMALSLALTTPIVALAAIGRVGPAAASLALLAGLGVAYFFATSMTRLPGPADLFERALVVAAAVFATGSLTCFVAPRRKPPPTPSAFDPFGDPSG